MTTEGHNTETSLMDKFVSACLKNPLMTSLFVLLVILLGIAFAPFDWDVPLLPRDPVAVDAIPDIGENQQIVFTEWAGRSPRDVEDQITYRLTTSLLGMPGVKSVRGLSMFGFSTIYIIFSEDVEFYWSRSRILEKINSLPPGALPDGVKPSLGPDATALGQVFWYTLEGQDKDGNPTGGWDLDELRTIQDWYVKDALLSSREPGQNSPISEVSSIGGYVKEYQVDVDPDAMRAHGVTLSEILAAVKASNTDVGARSIEVNRVEYVVRGVGLIKTVADIENAVIKTSVDNVPLYVRNVAKVSLGPALRRGALDKEGAEAVGGAVVVRFGENPLAAIKSVKAKIAEISPGLPAKTLEDGTLSQVKIVPFYDRTELIHETLDTLHTALTDEVLVTIVVVLIMLMHLGSSLIISALLPLAVLMCFIAMKLFGVDANIVALSGIAIAIGTMVDMGIVISENILRHLKASKDDKNSLQVIAKATSEVGSAVLTAVLTTVVGFLPVFMLTGSEGKLFSPLAYTKTFALIASLIISLAVLPLLAYLVHRRRSSRKGQTKDSRWKVFIAVGIVILVLARHWEPLGPARGLILNVLFVASLIGLPLWGIKVFLRHYERMLTWCLNNKLKFLTIPLIAVTAGLCIWSSLGREFMPPLDEGSYLYMPSTSPHASIGEVLDIIQVQDAAISQIPEVETVVGKLGRVESALDPAPVGMIETIITYKPEFVTDENGNRTRQWRDHIRQPDDIWDEILKAAHMPGITKPEKLQPISTRLLMLQSGIRGSMAVKIKGATQDSIEETARSIEALLKTGKVDGLDPSVVTIDRSTGNRKPYLEIVPDRDALAQYGLQMQQIQDVIQVGIGGRALTSTIEGRERYSVRVRYARELRDSIESLERILVPAPGGRQIPLKQLATIQFVAGPQVIKTEDTSLVGYVFFGKLDEYAEVNVVDAANAFLKASISSGELTLPEGTSYSFAGAYENQVRAQRTLSWVLPLALFIIFVILYLQFRSSMTSLIVFSGIAVAWSGGFIMIWLYGQDWFLSVPFFGDGLRDLFQVHTINLSVAIWVGFLALFGIATDDGVVMATYLDQTFATNKPSTKDEIRKATREAALHRIRPCLMTTATTILALLPVLTSTGRGADIMVPMAIPTFGGMLIEFLTMFVVPVLYCAVQESKLRNRAE
jgi:Cu(I)/Ag(I) efflux system membrane protein CusA/SilA